jgi:hypothetical protein
MFLKKKEKEKGMVFYTRNPSYSRCGGRRTGRSRAAPEKVVSKHPISKTKQK